MFLEIGYAQTSKILLNSSNENIWKVKPQADLKDISGEQISKSGFKISDPIWEVVQGVVFTAYVNAGKVPDRDADNICKVDESSYNRPFWFDIEQSLN